MLSSIQILRAMAAWAVVFHHYMQIFHGFESSNFLARFFSEYGLLGVDLFFIISGFVIYNSVSGNNVSPASFAIQRVARIAPAYWIFTSVIAVLAANFENLIPRTEFEIEHFAKSLFFIPAYSPTGIGLLPTLSVGWTLNYEMLFYGVFGISLFFPKKALPPVLCILVATIQIVASHSDGAFSFYGRPLIYDFLIGIVVSMAFRSGLVEKITPVMAITLIFTSLYVMAISGAISHSPIKAGIPLAVIFAATISQERFLKGLRFLTHLGNWSYSTYLVHIIVICIILKAFSTYNLYEPIALFLTIAFTLILSWVSYRFLEKPVSLLFKRPTNTSSRLSSEG